MMEKVNNHVDKKHWEIIPHREVPSNIKVIPSVWAMRRKRHIGTNEIYKWKARLNYDGSKQTKGMNYWDTYAPVASWGSIRLIMVLALLQNWKYRQLDFVQAYTQAEPEYEHMYMEVPKGFNINNSKEYVLKLKKNLYGQKQAGRVWNKHLGTKLASIGFKQSLTDKCVFY